MSVQNTNNNANNLRIDSYPKGNKQGPRADIKGNGSSKQNQGTLYDRLNAIDEKRRFNPSLIDMFNNMDSITIN